MAGQNQRDVSLIIRARDEASKTFDTVAGAVQDIVNGAASGQSKLQQFGAALLSLDKAASEVSSKFDTASQAIARMQQRAGENTTKFDALNREAQSLTRVVQILSTEADKAFVGPRRNGLTETLRAAKGDLTTLNREIAALSTSIARDLEGAAGGRSALQQLGSTEIAIAEASKVATAQIELQTQALRDMEAQAKSLTPMQQRINGVTGVSRPDATGSAAAAAGVLAVADAEFKVVEARNAEIQKLKQQEAATASLAREQEAQQKASAFLVSAGTGKSARDSAAVFMAADEQATLAAANAHAAFEARVKQGAVAMREEQAALARFRADLDPLAAITARAAAEQAKLDDWLKRGVITDNEAAQAKKMLAASTKEAAAQLKATSTNAPKVSLFGLRPYETQNLLFQVNDVVTQLGSGTSLSQTLAQQGGQIFQLFQNRIGPSIAAAFKNPYFLAAGAVIGTFALGAVRAAENMERLRTITAQLQLNVDGGLLDPKSLVEASRAMKQYGLSADDALKIVRAGVSSGLGEEQIRTLGLRAKDLATAIGVDVTQAFELLKNAQTGSYDDVKKLEEATGAYTAAQLEQIKALFEQGKAEEARALAADIANKKLEEVGRNAKGPWTEAAETLGKAWDKAMDGLANSQIIQVLGEGFNGLARAVSGFIDELTRMSTLEVFAAIVNPFYASQIIQRSGQRPEAPASASGNPLIPATGDPLAPRASPALTEAQKIANKEIADEIERQAIAAGKVTTEKDIQNKLDQKRKELALDAAKKFPRASDSARQSFIDAGVDQERLKLEDQLTQYKKQQADAAKRAADEARRANVEALQGDQRNKFVSTAQQFNGFSENNQQQRTSLQQFFQQNGIAVDPQMTAWCAAFVNAVLKSNGIKGTGSLSARSFMTFGQDATSNPQNGDIVVLKRGGNNAQGHVGFFQGFDEKGNVKVLGGNQGDAVNTKSFKKEDVLAIRRAPTLSQEAAEEQKQLEQNKKKQEEFNDAVKKGNEDRQESINALKLEQGLTGEALIAAQRKAAIDKAESDLRQKATADGTTPTQEQIDQTKALTAAQFDLAHARDVANAQRSAVDDPVRELTAQRDSIQQQIKFLSEQGKTSAADALGPQLGDVNARLDEAIKKAQDFYAALANNPQAMAALGLTADGVKNIQLGLQNAQVQSQSLGYVMGLSLDTIAQQMSSGIAGAFDQFAQKVAAGENVFTSLKDAFLQFAATFLRQIAQMIIQQTMFNLISGLIGSIGGSAAGGFSGAGGGGTLGGGTTIAHAGGIIGGSGMTTGRSIPASVFANAMRYHTGGIAGLKANEVPAVLQRNEEVLTRSDPRHILNGGGKGGAPAAAQKMPDIKIVNAIDAGDAMSKGLDTRVGQQAILNFISTNSEAVKGAMGQ